MGSALGPIGSLSVRQFNSCLPGIEYEDDRTNSVTALKDNGQSTRSSANSTMLSSLKGKKGCK